MMRAALAVVVLACCAVALASAADAEVDLNDAAANERASAELAAMTSEQSLMAAERARRALAANVAACTPKAVKCPRTGAVPFANGYQKPGTYNGCGAAGSWLDDSILGGKFTPCCNQHDLCYGRAGAAKAGCDTAFHTCMYRLCTGATTLFCRAKAGAYYQAVASFGCGAYESARIENGCPATTLRSGAAGAGAGALGNAANAVASAKRRAAVNTAYEAAMRAMSADLTPAPAGAAAPAVPAVAVVPAVPAVAPSAGAATVGTVLRSGAAAAATPDSDVKPDLMCSSE